MVTSSINGDKSGKTTYLVKPWWKNTEEQEIATLRNDPGCDFDHLNFSLLYPISKEASTITFSHTTTLNADCILHSRSSIFSLHFFFKALPSFLPSAWVGFGQTRPLSRNLQVVILPSQLATSPQ